MPTSLSEDAFEPVSRSFASQGLNLHYVDWGNQDAPLLILLHGMRDHARSWDWTARALRDRFHVVALDLRGHGDSQWSPDGAYLPAYHVLDLAQLLDTLGRDRATLVSHSFGGGVASRCAAMLPERVEKLVIVDGMGPSADALAAWAKTGNFQRSKNWLEERRALIGRPVRRFPSVEDGAARMAKTNPRLSPEQVRHLAVHGLDLHADGYSWKFDPAVGVFMPEDFAVDQADFWCEVQCPTLICYGTESWTSNPMTDGRAVHFRDHRIVVFEGAGHWLHHDQSDAFMAALRDFL